MKTLAITLLLAGNVYAGNGFVKKAWKKMTGDDEPKEDPDNFSGCLDAIKASVPSYMSVVAELDKTVSNEVDKVLARKGQYSVPNTLFVQVQDKMLAVKNIVTNYKREQHLWAAGLEDAFSRTQSKIDSVK
jgi:hypothetical protein